MNSFHSYTPHFHIVLYDPQIFLNLLQRTPFVSGITRQIKISETNTIQLKKINE